MLAIAGTLLLPQPVQGLAEWPARVKRRTLWAMGGWHQLAVTVTEPANLDGAMSAAVDELRLIDRTFTVFDERSPLSRINASPETSIPVDDALVAEGLGSALSLAAATDGAFDPTVEKLMREYGFHPASVPFRRRPQPHDSACGHYEVEYDATHHRLRRASPTIALDPGGWAKGWAAQRAAEAAMAHGAFSATVNCGGDIYYAGGSARTGRKTEIRNPEGDRFEPLLSIRHRLPAVATSANTESLRKQLNGDTYGHLMDPRIARPAATDCVSATVFSRDGLEADAVASALFVMGIDDAQRWLTGHQRIAAVLIRDDGRGGAGDVFARGPIEVERC